MISSETSTYPVANKHSYGKWPLGSWVFQIKMVIFQRHMKLLEDKKQERHRLVFH